MLRAFPRGEVNMAEDDTSRIRIAAEMAEV